MRRRDDPRGPPPRRGGRLPLHALPALDEATIETLRQHNDDVMAFMQQAQQQSLQSVEQLQAIVSRLVADIEAARADAEP